MDITAIRLKQADIAEPSRTLDSGFCADSFFVGDEESTCFDAAAPFSCTGTCVPFGLTLETCMDEPDFFFRREARDCDFIANKSPAKREKFCNKQANFGGTRQKVYLFCPIACGLC